jgi:hypothetical protein
MEPVPQKYRDALLPRYTSYPTAPHFSPDIGSTTYSEWLSRVAEGEAISLYLHVLQDYVLVLRVPYEHHQQERARPQLS